MRILLINDFLKPVGGAEILMHAIKDNLEKKGHNVELLGSNKVEDFTSLFSRWYSRKWYKRTSRKIKEFRPDVVHINNCGRIISPSVIDASLDANIPTILNVHDYHYVCSRIWATDKEGNICKCWSGIRNTVFSKCIGFREGYMYFPIHLLKILRLLIHRRVLKNKKLKIVVASKSLARLMMNSLGVKVGIAPVGMNIPNEKTSYRKKILFVGRISKENGLQTVANVLNKVRDYKVLIAGDGSLREKLEQKYKNLKFLGWQKPEKHYKTSSISLVPSIWLTNHPLSVFEAMSYGLCVITSNHGGTAEQVKHMKTGLLFEPNNEKDFEEKLNYLLKNPKEIKRMGKNAREFVNENFNWNKIVKKYEKLYQEAIDKN